MNFRRGRRDDAPEINLIPFIDILLVIVIFLAVTTTYSRFAELKIDLPTSGAEQAKDEPKKVEVAVTEDGRYQVDSRVVVGVEVETLVAALQAAAAGAKNPVIVVNADARASHQSVVNGMESARLADMARLTFATQTWR